jgi:O-antigen ligase
MDKLKSTLLLVFLFLTPLIVFDYTYENFEFPKVYFIYFFATLLFGLFVFDTLFKKKYFVLPDWIFWIYLLTVTVSVAFSEFINTSLWGYYTRFNGGYWFTAMLFLIFIVFINWRPEREKVIKTLLLTLLPVSLYAIFQHFLGELRAGSTFGQPNWAAAYISMLLPILFLSIFEKKSIWYFWAGLFVVSFAGLWFTYSLSGLLSLGAGMGVVLLMNKALVLENKKRAAIVLAVSLFVALLNLGLYLQRAEDMLTDLKKVAVQTFSVYAENGNNLSDTGFIRTGMWEGTVKMIFSDPKITLIGIGPENFPYVFPRFRPNSLNYSSEWDYILNKPHNYYLQLGAETGLIGLLTYIALVVYLVRKKDPVIAPALVSFAVSNFFGWPTAAIALVFWVFASYLNANIKVKSINLSRGRALAIFVISAVILLLVEKTFVSRFYADLLFRKSTGYIEKASDLGEAVNNLNGAIALNNSEAIYYRWRAKTYLALLASSDSEDKKYLKDLTLSDLETALSLNPENLATMRNSVPLYYLLAVRDYGLPSGTFNIDLDYAPYAYTYFEKLADAAPNDVGVYVLLAKYQNRLGMSGSLEKSVEVINRLRPDLFDWHEDLIDLNVSL